MLILILFSILVLGSSALLVPETDIQDHLKKKKGVVGFYNVYAEGIYFDKIVQTQVQTINGSGLLDKLDTIFYATMGNNGSNYEIGNSSKYVHIAHYGSTGGELQTIKMLYQFCHANPRSKVLYFHNKGSLHYSPMNEWFCNTLNCYVLNPHCLETLDRHDTCGWRISPIPFVHYSGNFWWARCQYVNSLVDPLTPLNNQTYIDGFAKLRLCVHESTLGQSRYFAEMWIGTGPRLFPADCMNSTIDKSYVAGYNIPPAAAQHCHGPDKPSGLPCTTASTYKDVQDFAKTIISMTVGGTRKDKECRDVRTEFNKLSLMLYGEPAYSYLSWLDRVHRPAHATEGSLVRFADSTQLYVMKEGVLRKITDLQTLMAIEKQDQHVQTIFTPDRRNYRFGE